MKRLSVCVVGTLLLLTFMPFQLKAITDSGTTTAAVTAESAQVSAWVARLDEIHDMDKSAMTRSDKKELRQEVRTIKANLKAVGGGVYLSAGAIILIIILIVLLL